MNITDTRTIKAKREEVFKALNDPEVLRKSIEGCVSLDSNQEGQFDAVVEVKVGPVKAKFKGQVELSDVDPPKSYTISGSGNGGPAGVASGSAKVSLTEEGDATKLHYEVEAKTSGKLAQLGNRVMMSVAKSQADKFFSKFASIVEGEDEKEDAAAPAVEKTNVVPWLIGAALVIAAAAAYFLSQ